MGFFSEPSNKDRKLLSTIYMDREAFVDPYAVSMAVEGSLFWPPMDRWNPSRLGTILTYPPR